MERIITYNNYNFVAFYLHSTLKVLQNTFMSSSIPKEPESGNLIELEICYTLASALAIA